MAAAFQIAPAAAVPDELSYWCDRCRSVLGVGFTDHFWVCGRCRAAFLRALDGEQSSRKPRGGSSSSTAMFIRRPRAVRKIGAAA
jgi:hypothetical protein